MLASKVGGDAPVDTAFYLSSKKGPNGPSLETLIDDAHAFIADDKLVGAWRTLNAETKPGGLSDIGFGEPLIQGLPDPPTLGPTDIRSRRRDALLREASQMPREDARPIQHSRIAAIPSGGCKTRIVAICDWFTQDALKPIHEWAFRVLGKIRQDGTFSHNRIAQRAKLLSGVGMPAWCFDLTAATDRFPALMQKWMLGALLGNEVAEAWYVLVTQRAFSSKGMRDIVYAVGQPMGALSSWAVFSLTHHVIVQMAAIEAGVNTGRRWFAKYIMIGDDIAIFHKGVAEAYMTILKDLDVPLNLAKSMTPPPEGDGLVEIAKRTFYRGLEYSPCPPDIILQAKKDASIFPLLIRVSQDRDIANANDRGSVLSLMQMWYPPHLQSNVELVLYDPRDSRALLQAGVDPSENPWNGMDEADVYVECDFHLLRRINTKAQALEKRLNSKRPTSVRAATASYASDRTDTCDTHPNEASYAGFPVNLLVERLKLVTLI